MSGDLFMLRLGLELSSVVALAKRRRLPMRQLDEGQAVHCALGELFRDKAPSPFFLSNRRSAARALEVWAYSGVSKDELIQTSDAFGDIDLHERFDPTTLKQRRLPDTFPERVGFSVRLCPVVRLASSIEDESDGVLGRKGAEVDAFEALRLRAKQAGDETVDASQRNQVYLDWFAKRVARLNGVELVSSRLSSSRRGHFYRRDHGSPRTSRKLVRPEITVDGELNVTDQGEFRELLRRGIGRHKAFGFGMLMLRPARGG